MSKTSSNFKGNRSGSSHFELVNRIGISSVAILKQQLYDSICSDFKKKKRKNRLFKSWLSKAHKRGSVFSNGANDKNKSIDVSSKIKIAEEDKKIIPRMQRFKLPSIEVKDEIEKMERKFQAKLRKEFDGLRTLTSKFKKKMAMVFGLEKSRKVILSFQIVKDL